MTEYIYQETDYIKEVDLAEFHRIMILYGFMPVHIPRIPQQKCSPFESLRIKITRQRF